MLKCRRLSVPRDELIAYVRLLIRAEAVLGFIDRSEVRALASSIESADLASFEAALDAAHATLRAGVPC